MLSYAILHVISSLHTFVGIFAMIFDLLAYNVWDRLTYLPSLKFVWLALGAC